MNRYTYLHCKKPYYSAKNQGNWKHLIAQTAGKEIRGQYIATLSYGKNSCATGDTSDIKWRVTATLCGLWQVEQRKSVICNR